MRILLTGCSSMTGLWFAKALADKGHDVTATFTRPGVDAYDDPLRKERVSLALNHVAPVFDCVFGDDTFLKTIIERRVDVLCHHGADVTDYKSPDFDVSRAFAKNTNRIAQVLRNLREYGGGKLVLTGSVFEGGEGAGSNGLPHFSPYGLSKALTSEAFRYHCQVEGVSLGKFVIPNPFGAYEGAGRFTSFLMSSWQAGKIPKVQTPNYVRDNVHASLLAVAYCRFVEHCGDGQDYRKINPSGYAESQHAFAERMAREVRTRIGWECKFESAQQMQFAEPQVRINTEPIDGPGLNWNESAAWDEFTDWYRR